MPIAGEFKCLQRTEHHGSHLDSTHVHWGIGNCFATSKRTGRHQFGLVDTGGTEGRRLDNPQHLGWQQGRHRDSSYTLLIYEFHPIVMLWLQRICTKKSRPGELWPSSNVSKNTNFPATSKLSKPRYLSTTLENRILLSTRFIKQAVTRCNSSSIQWHE